MEEKTMLDWTKFEPLFGTWAYKLKPFFDSGGFDPIYKLLKKDIRRGKKIVPSSSDTFRCFLETSFDDLKVVMMGMCPYHTMKNGQPVADGLLMGCSNTDYLQPSLDLFYKGVETELYEGLNLQYVKTPNVDYLAHQGVLMINAALTTEVNKPGSHLALWEPFIKYLFEEVLDASGVPVIFLGKEAAKMERYVAPFTWVFKASHPASAAYTHTDWETEDVFKGVNKVLKDRNNFEINWLYVPEFRRRVKDDEGNPDAESDLPF